MARKLLSEAADSKLARQQEEGVEAPRILRRRKAEELRGPGHFLAPGYVDLHTHGAVGVDFVTASAEEFGRAMDHYLAHGVTSILVSLYPASPRASLRVLERVAGYVRDGVGRGVARGIHLEGPFLSRKRPGALPLRYFRRYDRRVLDDMLKAGGGFVRTMTVAPEEPGGMHLVRALLRRGVAPAFGHSDADYAATRRALGAGVRYATHLFNAMRGVHHRAPGAVTALLEDPDVAVEVIADGYHIDLPVLRLVNRVKPARSVILVSDSVHSCGLRPGRYRFAGSTVVLEDGRVTLEDGTLAGSALTLDRGVALEANELGMAPARAVEYASGNPARLAGFADRGAIAPQKRADIVLLDKELRVRATWLEGRLAWVARS